MTALLERDDGPSPDRQSLEEGLNGLILALTGRIDQLNGLILALTGRIDQLNGELSRHGDPDAGDTINDLHEYRRALQVIRASIWPDRYEPPHGRRPL